MNALPPLEKRYWWGLGLTLLVTFVILGFFGNEIYRQAPPIPDRVVACDDETLFTRDDILTGQQVWQSTGGQQLGSVWGHGAYQAPDWSADWLHRESLALLDLWAVREYDRPYDEVAPEIQAGLRERLKGELRTNTFDPESGTVTLLSLGLVILIARRFSGDRAWKETPLAVAFWTMNGGLALMVGLSLLPIGIAQTLASVETGLWYARSADFLRQPWLQTLRWMRMPGDSLFLIGVAAFAWFMTGLWRGWSYETAPATQSPATGGAPVLDTGA